VRAAPDVLVCNGSPVLQSLMEATQTIPIVFVNASDPVGTGLVTSFARPAGNATGFTNFELSMGGKWLEILKEIAPAIRWVLVLFQAANPASLGFLRVAEAAAPSLGITLSPAPASTAAEIEARLDAFTHTPDGGLLGLPGPLVTDNHRVIVERTLRYRVPSVFANRRLVEEGALVSYGIDNNDQFRRAADYVDRILRGGRVSDLPVQAPTKFEFVVNLKTARALGLTLPLPLIGRTDEVIE